MLVKESFPFEFCSGRGSPGHNSPVYNYFLLSYQNNGKFLHPLAPFDLLCSMLRMIVNNIV
jgi:hypothetical protein